MNVVLAVLAIALIGGFGLTVLFALMLLSSRGDGWETTLAFNRYHEAKAECVLIPALCVVQVFAILALFGVWS